MATIDKIIQDAITEIDQIATDTAMNFISANSYYMLHEYEHAAHDATEWMKDTSVPCPLNVTAWAQASNTNNVEAAEYIIQKAVEFKAIVSILRQIRLSTKVMVRQARSQRDIDEVLTKMKIQISSIASKRPLK